jgi:hypothetical protein
MAPLVNCLRLQVRRPLDIRNTVVRLNRFCLLLAILSGSSSAQNTQGLPVVGAGGTQASSQMLLDATQFAGAPDMCLQIKNACLKLGAGGYPSGATIDARGFTGDQVCAQAMPPKC